MNEKANDMVNTGVYLSIGQYDRLQVLAKADNRSASNLIGVLIDQAWAKHLEADKKDSSPTKSEV